MFFDWLDSQRGRADDVGRYAAFVAADRTFPRRSHRLYVLLRYCAGNGELRRLTKLAHAEWRKVRSNGSDGAPKVQGDAPKART